MCRFWLTARGSRSGMTLIELVIALAAVGLLGFTILSYPSRCTVVQTPAPVVLESSTEREHVQPAPFRSELSLQETLDRLGYTVNVPLAYHGHTLARFGSSVSSRDDSVPAGWFQSDGEVKFQIVSQQSAMGPLAQMSAVAVGGERLAILSPDGDGRFQFGHEGGRTATIGLSVPARLAIELPSNGWPGGEHYSTPSDNRSGSAQLVVLPALTGGRWVKEGDGIGYWEGGVETGDYLLCWEDLPGGGDRDFQDLVILARGLRPITQPREGS